MYSLRGQAFCYLYKGAMPIFDLTGNRIKMKVNTAVIAFFMLGMVAYAYGKFYNQIKSLQGDRISSVKDEVLAYTNNEDANQLIVCEGWHSQLRKCTISDFYIRKFTDWFVRKPTGNRDSRRHQYS